MFHVHDVAPLREGERIQGMIRRHVVTLLPMLSLSALFIITPFFFLFPLLRAGSIGAITLVLSVAIGLSLALRAIHLWDADVLIVTTERVIDVDQSGVWARQVAEIPLGAIHDIRWERRGFHEALFRLGTVRLSAAMPPSEVVVSHIAHPERVEAWLQELCHPKLASTGKDGVSHDTSLSRREHIQWLLVQASEPTLVEVEALLANQSKADDERGA